jgi:hypothetical protein
MPPKKARRSLPTKDEWELFYASTPPSQEILELIEQQRMITASMRKSRRMLIAGCEESQTHRHLDAKSEPSTAKKPVEVFAEKVDDPVVR